MTTYDDYFNFIQFLAIEPLTLVYVTNNTYYVSVDLKQIDKSEIEDGILKCDILFKRLGRWYQEKKVQNMDAATDGKVYSHGYPVTYSEYDAQTVTVDCDSSYDAPTRLIIFGPCVNPYWNHYLNGKIIATGKCNCSIQTGRRLVIDCLGHKYGIREEDSYGNVKNNYYGASDFETKRFIELGLGKNRIAVDHDGTNTLKILIEARVEYETV